MDIGQFLAEKLKWGKNEFGDQQFRLMLGGLYIGEIQRHNYAPGQQWRAWFSDECEGNSAGLFATADEARAAVEKKLYEAIGLSLDGM